MGVLDSLLDSLGVKIRRTHLLSFAKPSTPGIEVRFTRDLRPIDDAGLPGGHLVELWGILDESHAVAAAPAPAAPAAPVVPVVPVVRFDVLEEDWLVSGGLDDQVISLVGTGATAPSGFITAARTTDVQDLPAGREVREFVAAWRRATTDFESRILVLVERGIEDGKPSGTRRTHVLAWWRTELVDDPGSRSELYFQLEVDGKRAGSPTLETSGPPAGVSVRISGILHDSAPLLPAVNEPLAEVGVALGGRTDVTGPEGTFLIDARLPVGDHPLRVERPGLERLELSVHVEADVAGAVTATLRDVAGLPIASASTPGPSTQASVVAIALPAPLRMRVHKLRGKVIWPDSRGAVTADYPGSPLAERRVYVLPLPGDGALSDQRPKTTREWEALKLRRDVLRSARPGRPAQRERTDTDGRFEVKYVDFTAGKRYLLWVERLAPTAEDAQAEAPDLVVRTLQRELIELTGAAAATLGNAGNVKRRLRNLVDHDYNLTRDTIAWSVDALRVVDVGATRTLVRPDRATREQFETGVLPAGVGERFAVPPSLVVDPPPHGLTLQVLPLVPVGEAADVAGPTARRMADQLAAAARAAFTLGFDARRVRLALDAARLVDAVAMGPDTPTAASVPAKVVELLEQTLIVRPQLGRAGPLRVIDCRWHVDAVSLADGAFVWSPGGVQNRALTALVAPVLETVVPFLVALAPRLPYVAPGHGLYPSPAGSGVPGGWDSPRGGYNENAGEDEVDALVAASIRTIAERNAGKVETPRETADFTRAGVSNAGAGVFVPVPAAANPDFPRLWQQNPVYYFGATFDPEILANPNWAAGQAWGTPAGNKNSAGIESRVAHIRSRAAAGSVDLVLCPHTNAGGSEGLMVEYLNVQPTPVIRGEGNPLGQAFARRLLSAVQARTGLQRYSESNITQDDPPGTPTVNPVPAGHARGLRTMNRINAETVKDLVDTFAHVVRTVPAAVPNVERLRAASPGGPLPAGWAVVPFAAPSPLPVALVELAFHDSADDAPLLARQWFRRLAAEGMSEAIDGQLRDDPRPVTGADVRAVLTRAFGETPSVTALAGGAAPLAAAAVQVAVRAAGQAAAAVASPTLDALATAVLAAARAQTRRGLVEALRAELERICGYEAADATDVDRFVVGAMVGAQVAALQRPDDPVTREEAGAFACSAVGLLPASLQTAESQPVPAGGEPLMRRAVVARDAAAYFPPVEAAALVTRVHGLAAEDVYRVAGAALVDAAWRRLDAPRGSGSYELDRGTAVQVLVDTAGAAWKADAVKDVEITVHFGGRSSKLAGLRREPRRLVSATWQVTIPPTAAPVDVKVSVRVKHRTRGWLAIGNKILRVKVLPPPPP